MQVIINGKSVVVEYSSNLEIARHIAHLNEMLKSKLEDPRRMQVAILNFVDSHGNPSGEMVHRTEY